MIIAKVVLPRPGGPESKIWSAGAPLAIAASVKVITVYAPCAVQQTLVTSWDEVPIPEHAHFHRSLAKQLSHSSDSQALILPGIFRT